MLIGPRPGWALSRETTSVPKRNYSVCHGTHRKRLSILTRIRPEGRRTTERVGRGGGGSYGASTGGPAAAAVAARHDLRAQHPLPPPPASEHAPPARKQQASFILISRSRTGSLSSILANGPRRLRRDPASSSPSLPLPSLPTRTVARLPCVVDVDVAVAVDWMTGSPPIDSDRRPSRLAMRSC